MRILGRLTTSSCSVLLLILSVLANGVRSKDKWSKWFDDTPTLLGDNQTLGRIRQVFGYWCPVQDIVEVECRVVGSDTVFNNRKWYQGNNLSPPCDVTGVACSEFDQILEFPSLPCRDYEIRFMCREKDSTSSTTELQNPLSVHGGFIALAAGLSVVVPLICVLIVQLRRAKREELNRATRGSANGDGNENCAEGSALPPPTYEELFGPDYDSRVAVVHSRYRSTDVLIHESELVVDGEDTCPNGGGLGEVNSGHDDGGDCGEGDGERGRGGGVGERRRRVNHPNFFSEEGLTPIATISGSEVNDSSVSSESPSDNGSSDDSTPGNITNATSMSLGDRDLGDGSNVVLTSNVIRTHPPPVYSSSSLNANPSFPTTSSATQSPPQYTPPPPLSPPTPSSSSHSTSSPSSSSVPQTNQTSPNSHLPTTSSNSGFRLPGMHVSIQDILSVLREQSERELPPPSYEEALKILKKAEKEKRKKKK